MADNHLKPNYSPTNGEENPGSDSDTDSVEKQIQDAKKTLTSRPKYAIKPQPPNATSSEASEPGSDSDLLPNLSDFVKSSPAKNKRPPATNKKDPKKSKKNTEKIEQKKAKKKANKPVSRSKTISMSSPAKSKPPAPDLSSSENGEPNVADTNIKSVSRSKTISMTSPVKSKPPAPKRVWSEDDEIALLKGLIDFKTEKKVESAAADFYKFIKKSLHFDADRTQLSAKVRKLKSKYLEKEGTDLVFLNVHAEKVYELSKQLWGSISDSHISGSGTESKKNHSKKNKIDVSMFAQHGGLNINDPMIVPEETLKAGLALLDDSTRAEFDKMRKELMEQQLLVYMKLMELQQKEASAALEAIRSSGV